MASYTLLGQDDTESEDDVVQVVNRFAFLRLTNRNICQKLANCKNGIVLLLACLIIVTTVGTTIGLGLHAFIVVTPHAKVDFSVQAFAIPNHQAYQHWDALKYADRGYRGRRSVRETNNHRSLVDVFENDQHSDVEHRKRRSDQLCGDWQDSRAQKIYLVYYAQGNDRNILTENRIQQIHEIEQHITNLSEFKNFCYMDLNECDCVPINSVLTYFYPTVTAGGLLPNGRGSQLLNIDTAINWALSSSPMAYWFTDGRISSTFHQSQFLRSEIQFGMPLKGYKDPYDRHSEQTKLFLDFAVSLRDYLSRASTKDVKVLYGGTDLFDYEVTEVFWNDLRLSIFSVVFIVLFIFVLTSFSLWLTFWGILTILLSFPLAFFFYRVAFNIVDVGLLNGVAVFVIVGIGVDDIFVFINTFHQASHIDDLLKRTRHTLATAGKATFFTSFTTAAAFSANISSSIPAVHQFGLFMTLIVTCCWLLVVLMMPPVLVIWHQWFSCCERQCYPCCWKCRVRSSLRLPEDVSQFLECHTSTVQTTVTNQRDSDDDVSLLQFEDHNVPDGVLRLNSSSSIDDDPLLQLEEEILSRTQQEESDKKGHNLNTWFQGILYYCIALPVIRARVVIVVIFVGLLVISIGCFSQIHPATKPPQLFRPDTNLQMLLDLMANYSNAGVSCDECSGYRKPPATPPPTPYVPVQTTVPMTAYMTSYSPGGGGGGGGGSGGGGGGGLVTPSNPMSTLSSTRNGLSSTLISTRPSHISTASAIAATTTTTTATTTTTITSYYSTTSTRSLESQRVQTLPSTETSVSSSTSFHPSVSLNPCQGDACGNIQDRPSLEPGITVYVVFGIKGVNQTTDHVVNDKGTTVYDEEFYKQFQFSNLNVTDLCRLCKEISNASDLVLPNTSQCWPSGSAEFVESLLLKSEECQDVPRTYLDEKGNWKPSQLQMGYDAKGIKWLAFSFRATTYKGQSSFQAYEKYQKWESLMKSLTQSLPDGSPLRSMYQTSEFWKQVMMEIVAVSSAIYGFVLSLLICIVAVGIFTGHFMLLFITVMTMIGLVSLVLAIFFWAGWELGAIEAISLSILVGSSVDYCVHIVEGYLLAGRNPPPMQSDAMVRKWRTGVAISHIGTSVVSSALTTIAAAIPLTQTILLPFSRFGQIVAINTTVSIVYALTSCVAFLSLMAPARFTNSIRSAVIVAVIMTACAGLLFLMLFIISRGGVRIPAPNGEDLFSF